jgi:hypothetical protein
MATWTKDELHKIAAAEELELASRRPDGTLTNAVTIWVVRVGDDLFPKPRVAPRAPTNSWVKSTL